jgi:hypothetical protein
LQFFFFSFPEEVGIPAIIPAAILLFSIFWIFRSFGYFDVLAVDLLTVDLILCRPFVVRPYWLNPNFDLLSVDLLSVDLLSVDLLPWYHYFVYNFYNYLELGKALAFKVVYININFQK